MKKLAVVITHPIQYYAPVFALLNQRGYISVKVFYTWGSDGMKKYDPGFNRQVEWDVPLLDGYDYEWVENTSINPGSHHRMGIVNPGLINGIIDYNPDAVLVFGWAYHSHLKAMRYFKNKKPVYFRGDSHLLDEQSGLKSIVRKFFLNWIYKHVNHAFYVGTNNYAYYKKYGLTDKQLSFAPHAVDNERFAANRLLEAKEFRANLKLSENDILILFAGKFEAKKSPQLLLDAFLAVAKPGMHLLFTGNGQLKPELKLKAAQNPQIHFSDFQNQLYMPVLYQACDIFCLPSAGPNETWGMAVNEAMACARPVLVSNKCGCAVDLVTLNNGIIVKGASIVEIASGLKKLTADIKKLTKMGLESAAIISKWNFTEIAKAIETRLLNEKI